ncbi:MAG: hypothetical protein ACOH5I_20720 [Oligoflexus sp.]
MTSRLIWIVLSLTIPVPLMGVCIYDDDGSLIQCIESSPDPQQENRNKISRERTQLLTRIRDMRVDGVAYFGFGSMDAFRSGLNQVAYDMIHGGDFVDNEKQNCEGAKVVCQDWARFFGKVIPVLDESFVWMCGNWYQQCMEKIEAWEVIFDEMSVGTVRNRLVDKSRQTKAAASGGGGGGSSSGGSTGSYISQGSSKKDDKGNDESKLPQHMR